MVSESEAKEYIVKYIGQVKFDKELSDVQRKNLIAYVKNAMETGEMGSLRYLVYNVLGTYYYTDFLELNNSLFKNFDRAERCVRFA